MSLVRIGNEKIIAACNIHLQNFFISDKIKEALEKLRAKAKDNFESSINLSDHDFLLIKDYL
ncbi:hypothetical protein [Acetobacter malorum]|uniref:hypothetical protein n=1 Tax=Acetobacter malorum TaxID=178901 RepID=UPI001177636E|nr:hypothetical protein [Acetobacter malorum]